MSHTVAVGEFEGPLGLLLELIERRQLEVSQISVGTITGEYLEKVRGLKSIITVEDLSEFLQLGARLLYIKSLSLLPQSGDEAQNHELQLLKLELAEYRRFQAAAKVLATGRSSRTWQRPAAPQLQPSLLPMPAIGLEQLAAAFTRALKLAPAASAHTIAKQHLSIESVTVKLRRLLVPGFELNSLVGQCSDRLEIIVTFLAILELIRDGSARVVQQGQFDSILVEAAHV